LLGLPTPAYAHLPLVTAPDGAKLSKRDSTVSLARDHDLAAHGARLIATALMFLGQRVPDKLFRTSCSEVLAWGVENFDPALISRQPGPPVTAVESFF
jgi:glutamyl-Q tRNA(Asp) synthetase